MVSYSNVDDRLEGYKVKAALPYKIFITLQAIIKLCHRACVTMGANCSIEESLLMTSLKSCQKAASV